jgi:hypothetical protein
MWQWMNRSTFCFPGRFTPGERDPSIHWIGGWLGLRTGVDAMENRNSWPHRDSNSDSSVLYPAASRYLDSSASNYKGNVFLVRKGHDMKAYRDAEEDSYLVMDRGVWSALAALVLRNMPADVIVSAPEQVL